MKSFWNKLHKVGDFLHLPDLPNWLLGILALVLILRIPSFFEPYYYGDEMIYLSLGQGLRQGIPFYSGLHDNKPPLLYLTAALAGNLFWFKVILAFWNIATIVFFYKLVSSLFENSQNKTVKLATLLFGVLTTIPLLEGNIVNAELFMIGPVIIAFTILLKKTLKTKEIFFAGVLFGIAALFKIPAMFEVPVIVVYWLITSGLSDWKNILKKTLILGAGFLAPILLTFVWYFFKGILPEYIKAAFLQNVGYLSTFRPEDAQKSFLAKNAPLLIRGIIAFFGIGLTFIFRKKLSSRFIFLTVWTIFTLFAVALSERPYPHYFVQSIAPVAIFLSMLFTDPGFEQSLVIIPLTLAFSVPVIYKFYYYQTTSYYVRFVEFAAGKINKEAYFNKFAPTVVRNYKIADFLTKSSTTKDRVFMYDPDSPTVYALSRRLPPIKFVADYHINEFAGKVAVSKEIIANPPKFIILTSKHPFNELLPLLRQKYLLVNQIENTDIFSRIDYSPAK